MGNKKYWETGKEVMQTKPSETCKTILKGTVKISCYVPNIFNFRKNNTLFLLWTITSASKNVCS